jgi:hypothetical protein
MEKSKATRGWYLVTVDEYILLSSIQQKATRARTDNPLLDQRMFRNLLAD